MGSGLGGPTKINDFSFLQFPAVLEGGPTGPRQEATSDAHTPELLHVVQPRRERPPRCRLNLSLIHISEPTRLALI
eukprot:8198866-Alexandrium_andersonii.AAC.1